MISFVVPAHNEQEHLPATLTAIREAVAVADLGEAVETIVVDDASTDGTAAVAAGEGARVHSVAYRQIAAARNAGAVVARGRFLFFVDADTLLNAALLRAACAAMDHETVGGGARIEFDVPLTPALHSARISWNLISRLTRWAAGCFLFVRREAFEQVGGFNEQLYAAEEIDLSARLKRLGPFAILSQPITTSARKLESHSVGAHFAILGRTILSRGEALKNREHLGLWYAVRQQGISDL